MFAAGGVFRYGRSVGPGDVGELETCFPGAIIKSHVAVGNTLVSPLEIGTEGTEAQVRDTAKWV